MDLLLSKFNVDQVGLFGANVVSSGGCGARDCRGDHNTVSYLTRLKCMVLTYHLMSKHQIRLGLKMISLLRAERASNRGSAWILAACEVFKSEPTQGEKL